MNASGASPAPRAIPLSSPFLTGREEHYVKESFASGKLSGDGPFTRRVRTWIEQELPARQVLLTTSCTAALELAAVLIRDSVAGQIDSRFDLRGEGRHDVRHDTRHDGRTDDRPEVIVPAYTFVSTANAFLLHGFKPVFCDVREDTGNADASTIAARITPRTRAVVAVHYAGVPCDMVPIAALARARHITVVEDAAQALTSSIYGASAGTFGDLAAFSFHDTKNFVCGEGGALVVNRDEFAMRAEIVREKGTNRSQFLHGHVDKYTWVDVGSSFLSSDILAAFLLAQLESRARIASRRRELFERYVDALSPLAERGLIHLPTIPHAVQSNHHLFFVLTESLDVRTHVMQFLNGRGIGAAFHYPALHRTPMGRLLHDGFPLPGAERFSDRLLRLPLYVDLTDDDQQRVIDGVIAYYRGRR